jgi:lipopolysaccharide/colanic/teichoic acid biosynthesis glycosyltransferase
MLNFLFNRLSAALGIIILLPVFLLIAIAIAVDSKGGVFYIQERIGKNGKPFGLFKFRTMRVNADLAGKLTVGDRDPRITRVGYYLRKYKVDELPQLFNVMNGTMNLVGPRPEVQEYVEMYTPDQRRVLNVRPGITDYASLKYFNESELLAASTDPRKTYVEEIMPEKLRINLTYIERRSMAEDLKIIAKTVGRIIG